MDGIINYYRVLNKPPLTPPDWVFAPTWTILYITMGIALYLFWNSPKKAALKEKGYLFFILQLIANFLWSLIFFNLQSAFWGLIDLGAMIILTGINIYYFNKINRNSALMLLPYLVWILFATYLNIGILLLN